jgi:hypothetical protein
MRDVDEYLSSAEVAQRLGVSPRTVARWRKAGLASLGGGARGVRLRWSDVLAWLDRDRRKGGASWDATEQSKLNRELAQVSLKQLLAKTGPGSGKSDGLNMMLLRAGRAHAVRVAGRQIKP